MDVPRTAPDVPFFAQPAIQKSLERILYLWGIRYFPALSTAGSSLVPFLSYQDPGLQLSNTVGKQPVMCC